MTLIIIIVSILVLIWLLKPYIQRYDNVVLYTGTLGSGKTFCGVKTCLKLLKRARVKVWFYNLFHAEKRPRPLLYSNIPVKISKQEWSEELKAEHFTMTEAIVPRSIVFTDEISLMLSQQDFKTVNDKALAEWCTLFRQYTKNGVWVLTTQSIRKVNHNIRRCLDTAFHLSNFRMIARLIYKVDVRHISVLEDVVNVNDQHTEQLTSRIYGVVGFRKYDTHAYYPRYKSVPFGIRAPHKGFTTLKICRIPIKTKLAPLITTTEDDKRE